MKKTKYQHSAQRLYSEARESLGLFRELQRDPVTPPEVPPLTAAQRPSLFLRGAYKLTRILNAQATRLDRHFHGNKKTMSLQEQKKRIQSLNFKVHASPAVSIVIPAYNKLHLTLLCLESLIDNISDDISYEVIVVDNASIDQTKLLHRVRGLVYLRNKHNLGFVGGCNEGAQKAHGEYLIFLNNDAQILPRWLENLYATIVKDRTIGLVGSKIIYPSGQLQEAGGIIFNDGTGSNYGKFNNANAYPYNYVRDVDYCSGASIIIKKTLFDEFGGFDMLYDPAYYEDTDLCFKVRDNGLRVVYQPTSVLYHIEGATSGTDINSGFKKFQEINRKKFIDRWKKELLKQPHPGSDGEYLGRNRRGQKLALIIDEHIPRPDKDSGSVRMMRFIGILIDLGYRVTFLPDSQSWEDPYTSNLQQMGVEVIYAPFDFRDYARDYGHFFNLVLLSHPRMGASYIDACEAYFTKAQIIYDTVDLHYLRTRRQAEYSQDREAILLESRRLEIIEKSLIQRADLALVVSDEEKKILKGENVTAHIEVLSNIHELRRSSYQIGFDERKDIVFVGSYSHPPNEDAVEWFTEKIFPIVLASNPKVRFHVVGSNLSSTMSQKLRKMKNVIVHGYVEDLSPILNTSRIFVAPLRFGAGVKGKIGQAIEYGIPIVSTSVGAEGMHLANEKSVLIADDITSFAKAILWIYDNQDAWESLRLNAKKVISKDFSTKAATEVLKRITI